MAENKTVFYRYRLQEDAPADRMGIDGSNLSKSDWLITKFRIDRLTRHVRSLNNPKGMVEFQEFDPFTNEVYATPAVNPPATVYDRDQMAVMTREQLVEIAKALDIDTHGAKPEMLVRKILIEQQKFAPKQPATEPAE